MAKTLRCSIYARFSSDKQSRASITDQVRKCREYAQAHGWEVLDDHVYSDEAISGATSERAGLKRLLLAAEAKAFDVILIDDTSRLSRKAADAMNFADKLRFYGVRLIFVSQNIDSENEQAEVLTAVHGIVDGLYIKELATKTRRGIEGRVLARQHSGGRIFGYRNVPIQHPDRQDQYGRPLIAGARLEVDEAQAKTVRKIYQLYAGGLSIKAVAKKLNADGVRSPQPRAGRQQSWAPSSVRVILRNERYRGVVTWGRTKNVRNPVGGKKVKRPRPKTEWQRVEMPEQRIIPEKLWLAVRERLTEVNRVYGGRGRKGGLMNARLASSPYVFSGLLKCGVCGANFTLVSGAGTNHKGYKRGASYGCPNHAFRGTCKNARRVQRDTLEGELLSKLQHDVLSDAAIDYCLEKLEEEIERRTAQLDSGISEKQKRIATLEMEVSRLAQLFVGQSPDSLPTVRKLMVERENERMRLVGELAGRKKGSIHKQMVDLRKFVKDGLADIRGLLAGKHSNTFRVREELARHIDSITLLPEGEEIRYKGQWKLLGSSGGAEGQS